MRARFSTAASALRVSATSSGGVARSFPAPFPLRSLGGYIDGRFVPAQSGATAPVCNPADGGVLCEVPDMGEADTRAAIAAAAAAFPAWSARPAPERCAIVRRLCEGLLTHADGLGALLSLEAGKPLEEAKGEVRYAADFFEWYAEEGKRPHGEVLAASRGDRRMLTLGGPVGPCALLTPWNFPAAMPARKVAPALAAGCTMVLRPALETPLSAMALAQLAEAAGVPPGVLNVVVGADHDATAGVLTASPDIRKVSFTGSTRVGKLLMAACAPTLKRLSLELGGQAPFFVFEDAGALLRLPPPQHTTLSLQPWPGRAPRFFLMPPPPAPPPAAARPRRGSGGRPCGKVPQRWADVRVRQHLFCGARRAARVFCKALRARGRAHRGRRPR